ncbi:MAG: oligosaccharide flippase family protein [Legionella sp.]|jgi:O-antigen/teichoic acid export membrane protein
MAKTSNTHQIIYYALGLVGTSFTSLLVLPIMTHYIDPTDYANLEILLTLINLITIVIGFGLNEALFRFGGTAKNRKFINAICSNATSMALVIGAVTSVLIIFFAVEIKNILPGSITRLQIIYLGISLIPCNVIVVQLNWLRLKENVKQFILVGVFRSLLQAVLVLSTLYAGYGVTGIMFASAATSIITLVYFLLFQLDVPLEFNKIIQKQLFFYGLPLSFNGIAEFVLMSLSNWWIAYVVGPTALAPFALAMKLATITSLIIYPFYMWWNPIRYKHLDTEESRLYTARISEFGVVVCYLAAYLVTIGSGLLIIWFIPISYHDAMPYLAIAGYMLASKYAADMMNIGLFLRKPQYVMYVNSVVAVITIIGFYYLIPLWHIWGAFLILQIALYFRWFAYIYLSQRELYLVYHYVKLFAFLLICELCGLGINYFRSTIAYIVIGGAGFIVLTVLAYLLQLIPPNKLLSYLQSKYFN